MSTSSMGRLLIVDDEEELVRALCAMLARHGYETEGFCSGAAAVHTLKQQRFDLLLGDLTMPEMDGVALIRHALTIDRDMVSIIMTGQGTIETAVEAMKVGAFDYLLKPFKISAILPVLARAMEVRRLRVEARRLAEQNAALIGRLEAEMARAREIQAQLLPRETPPLPGFELAARCIPAREVGGDFYDWQYPTPGMLSVTVGDVMGKGMPAALLMATMRATLRAVTPHHSPATALERIRQAMQADLEKTDSFVTLFHAQLDLPTRLLAYVDAGHGHVFLHHQNGTIETLQRGGPPIGVSIPHSPKEAALTFQTGDTLVMYSDGLVDSRPEGALKADRIALEIHGITRAEPMVEKLVGLAGLVGPPPDDLTVVVLHCSGSTK